MGTLSLTNPVNGQPNDATTITNNNAAIKTVVNGGLDATNLSDPGSNKVWGSNGGGSAAAVYPPGFEMGYDETTTNVSVGVSTDSSSATSVIAGSSHTFDGSVVMLEFWAAGVATGAVANDEILIHLYEGTTEVCSLAQIQNPGGGNQPVYPVVAKRRFAPSAGSHTYTVRANYTGDAGTIIGGNGTGSGYPPIYLRFTKA